MSDAEKTKNSENMVCKYVKYLNILCQIRSELLFF